GDPRQDGLQGRRDPDDLLEHEGGVEFFTQRDVLVAEPLFRLLPVLDVGSGYVPASDAALVVSQGVAPDEKPAILAVLAEDSRFRFPKSFALPPTPALIQESLHIVRMQNPRDDVLRPHRPQLFCAQTTVLQRYLVRIQKTPIWFQSDEYALRHE